MKPAELSASADATDEAVVQQVLAGDLDRFEVLIRRHNQRLFRTARAIVRDDGEAEDVVQHAYLAAYAALASFRGESRFSTWLTRIVIHESLKRSRKRGRLADLTLVEEIGPSDSFIPPPPSPESDASGAELRALLEAAVDALPDSYRVVVVLRDVQELSTRETADCLGLTEEAVRVRLHRARHALREWLYERADRLAGEAFRFAGERCDRIAAFVMTRLTAPQP